MGQSKEQYRAQPMGANATYTTGGAHVSGFLAVTAGTISIVAANGDDGTTANGTKLLNAMPVAVGFNRIPLLFPTAAGGGVTLGGGASGTLLL